jgi:hypothetical protein
MKTALISRVVLLTFSLSAFAQLPVDEKTGKVEYKEVIQLDGMSKDEIYKKAKMWMVSTLKSGDNMVELDGTNSEQIVGTGNLKPVIKDEKNKKRFWIADANLNFKFIVFCKEGRTKCVVKNLSLSLKTLNSGNSVVRTNLDNIEDYPGYGEKWQVVYRDFVIQLVNEHIRVLINDFKSSLQLTEENDW